MVHSNRAARSIRAARSNTCAVAPGVKLLLFQGHWLAQNSPLWLASDRLRPRAAVPVWRASCAPASVSLARLPCRDCVRCGVFGAKNRPEPPIYNIAARLAKCVLRRFVLFARLVSRVAPRIPCLVLVSASRLPHCPRPRASRPGLAGRLPPTRFRAPPPPTARVPACRARKKPRACGALNCKNRVDNLLEYLWITLSHTTTTREFVDNFVVIHNLSPK